MAVDSVSFGRGFSIYCYVIRKIQWPFGLRWKLAEVEDAGFPNHYFNFAVNEIGHRADSRSSILTEHWEHPSTYPVGISKSKTSGGLQLSATPATCCYLNPKVPEADHIRALELCLYALSWISLPFPGFGLLLYVGLKGSETSDAEGSDNEANWSSGLYVYVMEIVRRVRAAVLWRAVYTSESMAVKVYRMGLLVL